MLNRIKKIYGSLCVFRDLKGLSLDTVHGSDKWFIGSNNLSLLLQIWLVPSRFAFPPFLCSSVLLFLCFSLSLFFPFSSALLFLCSNVPNFLCSSVPLFFCSSVPLFLDCTVLLFIFSSVLPLYPFPCVPASHLPCALYSTTARFSRFLLLVVSFRSYFFPLFPYFSRHYSFFRPFSRFSLSSALLTSNSLIQFNWKQLHTSQSNKVITHSK